MDNVLIPWENVLITAILIAAVAGRWKAVLPVCIAASLCAPGSEIRLHYGTAEKSLECTGTLEFRGVQADLGEWWRGATPSGH